MIKKLKDLRFPNDAEMAHREADNLLLEFIADEEVSEAFEEIEKWYA